MGRGIIVEVGLVFSLSVAGGPAIAADSLDLAAAFTLIGQSCDDPEVESSASGSLDLYMTWTRGRGAFDIYIEGNPSLDPDGVAALWPESNGDVGTALDDDLTGRFQVSEAKYTWSWRGGGGIGGGLLDPSFYLDSTRIDNDENMQFLGAPFINNPTIEFPFYAPGMFGTVSPASSAWTWTTLVTSSHGLAGGPELDYAEVADFTGEGKGVFAGTEIAWPLEKSLVRVGAWLETERETLEGEEDEATGYGVYSVMGASSGRLSSSMRLGLANPHVSVATGFVSLGLQWDLGRTVLGGAAGGTFFSSRTPIEDDEDALQFEIYARVELATDLYLTPSIQYLSSGSFDDFYDLDIEDDLDAPPGVFEDEVLVFSLRLHYLVALLD